MTTENNIEEEIQDKITAITARERATYLNNHSTTTLNEGRGIKLYAENRRKMIKWLFTFTNRYNLSKETVYSAVSNLDRFINTKSGCSVLNNDQLYQLATISSLSISIKMLETMHLDHLNRLVQVIDGLYSKQDVVCMEKTILSSLKWKLNHPTPFTFIEYCIELIFVRCRTFNDDTTATTEEEKQEIKNLSLVQAEAALHNLHFCQTRPSFIAVASILNSIESYYDDNKNKSIMIRNENSTRKMFLESFINDFGITTFHKDLGIMRKLLRQLTKDHHQRDINKNTCKKRRYYHLCHGDDGAISKVGMTKK